MALSLNSSVKSLGLGLDTPMQQDTPARCMTGPQQYTAQLLAADALEEAS